MPVPEPEGRTEGPRGHAEMNPSLEPRADGWVLSDAWVLSAIRVTGTPEQPASLPDLIAAGDFLHQAILSPSEIEHAVGRLAAAMLITVDERGLAITPVGREVVARARPGTSSRAEALVQILRLLRVNPMPWHIDIREYEAACLEHRHRFWKAYGRRGGRRY